MLLTDFFTDIGFDVIKDRIHDEHLKIQARALIKQYVERQQELNIVCSKEEEIDFGGLTAYLYNGFHDDVVKCLFGSTVESRERAYNSIIASASQYANTATKISEDRVKTFIESAISVLHRFYEDECPQELKYIKSAITEDVECIIARQNSEQTAHFDSSMEAVNKQIEHLTEMVKNQSELSIEKSMHLIEEGKIDQVSANISDLINAISTEHILAPDYGFAILADGTRYELVSNPRTNEALRKYPPIMRVTGPVSVMDKQVDQLTPELIRYANNHQVPLAIKVNEAEQYLGDVLDPSQYEAKRLVGQKVIIPPKPFPKARACSVLIDGIVACEYVLLRVKEILDDQTAIITNDEQLECPISVRVTLNPISKEVSFSFSTDAVSNEDVLTYRCFLKRVSQGSRMTIHDLETGHNLVEGRLDPSKSTTDTSTLDDEISFLKKIVAIEQYFKETISLPEEFTMADIEAVDYIAALINGDSIRRKWIRFRTLIPVGDNDEIQELILNEKTKYKISVVTREAPSLFGKSYDLTVERTFYSIMLENINKIRDKLRVLDKGASIQLVFIPRDEKNYYIDRLAIEGKASDKTRELLNDD